MRMIVRFGKNPRLRFISHLDLQRFFQRALNRTGLPIAYSQGFNPHPVMAFASALALGWTSEYEVIDIKLGAPMGRKRAEEAMRAALPDDLPVLQVKMVEDKLPSLMPMVHASEYRIENSGVTQEMIADFNSKDEVLAIRKTKSGEREINIRPLAYELRLEGDVLVAVLALTDKDTLKPDLLVKTLVGKDNEDMRIHRVALHSKDSDGRFVPLMENI
ncbi:MAG: DUF2344 domain-containing protein [Clostridia bacterium]|nr:DUF2344 domain-containing protein [Clostridia bacterium]